MSKTNTLRRFLAVAAVLLLATAGTLYGQAQAGNLYGKVTDTEGNALPGATVTVELAAGGAEQLQVTDAQGSFRFLGLSPASYSLRASLDGFSTVEYPNIVINVGRNTSIEVQLAPAVEETITVTSESPLLDERKIVTGTTVSQVELEKIPSARDPWAVLQTVPGVQTDRINVGGNESGQQSQYTGPGSGGEDAQWAVDGVVITDMAAIGSSPSYYNFDAFEEMQAATGGSDASLSTGGVTLNMVTKRGTNEWRGSGRFIKADEKWQSGLDISASELGPQQTTFKQGNRIVSVEDYGVEVGGPIVRDKVWIWANYGKNEIDLLTILDISDFTELEDYGAKLNAQLTTANSLVAFYNFGDKIKIGRNAGPTRPQPTTWNQTGPTDIYKLEDTYVFSSSFFLTGMASYVGGGFQLTPQGGLDGPATVLGPTSWANNFIHHDTLRPQQQAKVDGNYFFSTGDVSHDLKFGVGYRKAQLESVSLFPGNGIRLDFYGTDPYDNTFQLSRPFVNDSDTVYDSVYAQDTMTFGNLTVNAGLRFDKQSGTLFAAAVPGVPGWETYQDGSPLLPATTTELRDQGFEWKDVTPRLGLTYALGAERKTLLRASYSRFAEQLRQGYSLQEFTGFAGYNYFKYEDLNNDGFVTVNEIQDRNLNGIFDPGDSIGTNGYDSVALSPDRVDPNFEAPLTDELILGVEHALMPEFVVGATLTLRNQSNIVEQERLVIDPNSTTGCIEITAEGCLRPHVRSDYVERTFADGRPNPITGNGGTGFPPGGVSIPYFIFRDGIEDTSGFFLTNGDREQDYKGLSVFFNKRLSNRWMLRGNVTLQDWTWDVPDSENEDPNLYLGGGRDDGGPVLQGSGTGSGAKGGIYISAGWSYSLTGMYQIAPDRKWGFNASAAITGREGYAHPYYIGRVPGFASGTTNNNIQATADSDDFANDDVHIVDLRLEKDIDIGDSFNVTVGLELFNALNEATVLQRQHRLGIGTSNHVLEVVSPRVWRIGVRFRFD
jgi:hypothetical protein